MSPRWPLSFREPLAVLAGALLLAGLDTIVDAQGYDQECYYAKDKSAGSAIIPCLDPSLYGVSWCCQNGDICLSDNACWNPTYNITYQYGCTDKTYQDDMCPQKCNLDTDKSHWVGLIFCGTDENYWACHHPDTCVNCPDRETWLPAIMSLPEESSTCVNIQTLEPAFAGPVSLRPSVWLPANGDTQVTYFSPDGSTFVSKADYTPDWVTAEMINPTSTPTATSDSTSDSAAATSTDSEDDNGGGSSLSTGAKAGIGVGVAAGALGLIAAAFILFRKKRQEKAAKSESPGEPGTSQPMMASPSPGQDPNTGAFYSPEYKAASPDPSSSNRMSELPSNFPSAISSPNPTMVGTPSPGPGQMGYNANSPYTPYQQYNPGYGQTPQMQQVPEHGVMGAGGQRPVSELPDSAQRQIHELQ